MKKRRIDDYTVVPFGWPCGLGLATINGELYFLNETDVDDPNELITAKIVSCLLWDKTGKAFKRRRLDAASQRLRFTGLKQLKVQFGVDLELLQELCFWLYMAHWRLQIVKRVGRIRGVIDHH